MKTDTTETENPNLEDNKVIKFIKNNLITLILFFVIVVVFCDASRAVHGRVVSLSIQLPSVPSYAICGTRGVVLTTYCEQSEQCD